MQTVDRNYFPLKAGQRVLDLGCGEGRHLIALSISEEVDAIGVDLSPSDLATARERMAEFSSEVPVPGLFAVLCGDALRLPFEDNSFDAVICSEVLEHIPDYRGALDELSRIIKPGGYFCTSVPRSWCEKICWALSRDYHQTLGGHLRIFNAADLRADISSRGFEPYHQHGAHALHSVYWWLQCLLWKTRERSWLVRQYHRLLVWDMMQQPALTRWLERLLNPFLGKSIVMYFRKSAA